MSGADDTIRASDAERDAVVEALRRHAADGRLTMTEFEDRVAEALAARTRGALSPVLRELPPLAEPSQQGETRRPRSPVRLPQFVIMAVIAVAVIAMLRVGAWWMIFPMFWIVGGMTRTGACGSHRAARHGHHSSHERGAREHRGTIRV